MENIATPTFRFITDSGHGWLEVPRLLLKSIDFTPSTYSYYNDHSDLVYLEEDSDAPKFKEAFGKEFKTIHHHTETDCFIRRLGRTL